MKKLLVSLAVVTALCATVVCAHRQSILSNDALLANVEALTDIEEAVITCDSGSWGSCFKPHITFEGWFSIPYYHCKWSGYQSDYCDWSMYQFN